jgi:hypothetical protein
MEYRYIQIDRNTGDTIEVPDGAQFTEKQLDDLAIGTVVPRKVKTSVEFLQNARDYNQRNATIYKQIELANQMYKWEGVVGSTVDLFVDFSITDFSLEGIEPDTREYAILNHFIENVNKDNNNMETGVRALLCELMFEYFTAGNAFPFKSISKVKGTDISNSRVRGTRGWKLPMNIYLLSPMNIEIPETDVLIGNKKIFLKIDEDLHSFIINNPTDERSKFILEGLPPSMEAQLREDRKIELPDKFISHIKRKSRGYDSWGVPYLTKAFQAFAVKKKLQALDEATIDGLINQITIFKVGIPPGKGVDDYKKTWSRARMQAFASLLVGANPSNLLVWTPDIEVETVGPEGKILSFDGRYAQADRDILKALGIPTVLISGEGASADRSENVWVSVSGLLEKLERARHQLSRWLEETMMSILIENELRINRKPKIRWNRMSLKNEKELRDFVTAFYDRGILPTEIAVKEAGYDWETIKERRLAETVEKIEGKSYEEIFSRRDLPFSGNGGSPKEGRPPGSQKDTTKTKTTLNDKSPAQRKQKNSQASETEDYVEGA